MLAYMNAEALERTLERGEMHFWSRSRAELWHKGATSGNVQRVRAIRYDCDADALLALVEPAGPACHTGERTCFYRGELEPRRRTRYSRRSSARSRSEPPRGPTAPTPRRCSPIRRWIGEKVQEEAEEVARAAREESDERVAEEAADVLYHLCVLLASRGLTPRRRRAGARWPSPRLARRRRGAVADARETRELLRVRPRAAARDPDRRLRDARLGVPEAPRATGPCFLLESADQGRVGRYSFIGYRPRKVLRWSLGDPGDPYALAAQELAELAGGAARRAAAVRRRRRRDVRLRPRADGRAARRAEPRPARDPRPGADADRRARRVRPSAADDHGDGQRLCRRGDVEASYARARETIAEVRRRLAGPVPRPAGRSHRPTPTAAGAPRSSNMSREQFEGRSRGSSSTSAPATPTRSCPPSAGRRRSRSARSRSTAGCAPSTRAPTCTSWTSATSRSPAPARSR